MAWSDKVGGWTSQPSADGGYHWYWPTGYDLPVVAYVNPGVEAGRSDVRMGYIVMSWGGANPEFRYLDGADGLWNLIPVPPLVKDNRRVVSKTGQPEVIGTIIVDHPTV